MKWLLKVIRTVINLTILGYLGVFFMNDIQILIVAIPHFQAFYLLGKIFLAISAIAGKGRDLQLENDLTI